jgi:Polyketide cyclase / dehydrase and lipid transport
MNAPQDRISTPAARAASLRARKLRGLRPGAVAFGASLCVFLAALLPVEASETREFSSQEEAELRAGKLVVRPQTRNGRGVQMLGGMSWQMIDAPPSSVWRALTDVHEYVKFLPAAEEVRLMAASGSVQSVFVQHRLGFLSGSYWINLVQDPAHGRVRFRLDHEHPSSIRDAWGELRVSAYGRDASVVSLVIMADLGEGLFVGLVRSNVHSWMLRVPELLKKHVEAEARRSRARAETTAL